VARGWPPLELRELLDILAALGLSYSHSRGGHDYYKGVRNGEACTVTVASHSAPFGIDLIKFMCDQARSNRKEFYGATERTAKKIR
jgi:hypothetical protein